MKLNSLLTVATACAVALAGCKTQKDLAYFEDIKDSAAGSIAVSDYEIRIAPQDELLITVTSEMPAAVAQYNQPMFSTMSRADMQDIAASAASVSSNSGVGASAMNRVPTYIVSREGDIDFPSLGRLRVAGMSTRQLADSITARVGETVKDPIVKVVLLNFKVNVLGEVAAPHTINVTTEKFSVLDALAACGDLTEFGRRDNVIIIRETADGQREYKRIDLHDTALFSSPYFYLKQNDIVYVEPNPVKQDNSKYNQNNSYKLSVASTIISTASIIASLIIALTVK